MSKIFITCLLLVCCSTPVLADDNSGFDNPASRYLKSLKKHGTKIFVNICKTDNGKAILILPLGSSNGMLFEVRDRSVINLAPLKINGKRIVFNFDNSQGACTHM